MNIIRRFFAFLGIIGARPSFWDVFQQEFDPEFERRVSATMHNVDVAEAFGNSSRYFDEAYHSLWSCLISDGTFSSCFFKVQRELVEFPDFDLFEQDAKLHYYGRTLSSYNFAHPILGIAQQNELEAGCSE